MSTPSRGAVYTVRRVAAASAALAAPSVALGGAEHALWGGNPTWFLTPPAGWGTGRVVEDIALSAAAAVVGVVAYRKTNSAIAKHDAAAAGLVKRGSSATARPSRTGTRQSGLAE